LLALTIACSAGSSPVESPPAGEVGGTIGAGPTLTLSPTPTPRPRPARDEARAALDAYLEALARQDFARALGLSSGPAHRLALVRLVLARHNADLGATTTVSLLTRRFALATRTARRTSFEGSATLRSVVRKPDAPQETTERAIADPVVDRVGNAWRVSSFAWASRPVVAYEGGAVARVNGVELRLEGSIAFGDVVGVVVLLVAEGERTVRVDADRLRAGGKEAGSGFRALIGGQPGILYISYPRTDLRPTQWRARVSVDGERPEEIVLSFG
jgi:hypothetical protein